MANREIAVVKWKNRQYCVIKYDYKQPGLYFGIVLLTDFKSAEMSLKKPATIDSYFVASSEEAKPTVRKVFTTSMELFEQQNQMSIARYFGSDYHLLGRRH